jgi:hypothetical protein
MIKTKTWHKSLTTIFPLFKKYFATLWIVL